MLELLLTLGLVALLTALAVPGIRGFWIRAELDSATRDFVAALAYARAEAVRRGQRVTLRNTVGERNWGRGWGLFVDFNANGKTDGSDVILRTVAALPTPLTLYANGNYINYIGFKPDGSANNVGTFVLCHGADMVEAGESRARVLIVSMTGRVRLAIDKDGDGYPEKNSGEVTHCTAP